MDFIVHDIIQGSGNMSHSLVDKAVKALPELVKNENFYNIDSNIICHILSNAGIISKDVALELIKGYYAKIGPKAAILLGFINCGELDLQELLDIIRPFDTLPMLQPLFNADDEDGIDIDYKMYYEEALKENKELKEKVLSGECVTYNVFSLSRSFDKPVHIKMYYKSLVIDGQTEPNVISSMCVDAINSMAEFASTLEIQAVSYQITPPMYKDPPRSWKIEIKTDNGWELVDEKNDCGALIKTQDPVIFVLPKKTPPFREIRFIHTGNNRFNDILAFRNFDVNGTIIFPTIEGGASLTLGKI